MQNAISVHKNIQLYIKETSICHNNLEMIISMETFLYIKVDTLYDNGCTLKIWLELALLTLFHLRYDLIATRWFCKGIPVTKQVAYAKTFKIVGSSRVQTEICSIYSLPLLFWRELCRQLIAGTRYTAFMLLKNIFSLPFITCPKRIYSHYFSFLLPVSQRDL